MMTTRRHRHHAGPPTPPGPAARPCRVRATQIGYYDDQRRRPGDVFDLFDDRHLSVRWMECVNQDTPTTAASDEARVEHQHLVNLGRQGRDIHTTGAQAALDAVCEDIRGRPISRRVSFPVVEDDRAEVEFDPFRPE